MTDTKDARITDCQHVRSLRGVVASLAGVTLYVCANCGRALPPQAFATPDTDTVHDRQAITQAMEDTCE